MNAPESAGAHLPRILYLWVLVAALALIAGTATADPVAAGKALRFFVVGDAPYADAEYEPFARLLEQAGARSPSFIVHVGDIKGGGQPCSEARNRRIATLFKEQTAPVLYTPGDNEWTDCHRRSAGRHDPLERLAAVRERFFADPKVLHNQSLGLVVPDPAFPENAYLVRDGVMLVLLHVVGSQNHHRPDSPSAMAEWERRSAANRALLQAATAAAREERARALVLFFHANPGFERTAPEEGFRPLLADLRRLLERYPRPVLAVHGDTHRFQFNQPLAGAADHDRAGQDGRRFWRLEVPGSPFLGGVWVTVTGDTEAPFKIEVVFLRAETAFEGR
ncbi:metallophosphoesterase family protein [Halochromatium glycolicum]|uniref:Calcineurin-like phosphoesterase domain-containing protein n=1 Tax=Halochromatium glycolicum TaxID=85075 RepID=A0AAJ0X9D8_9GAMM|nr:metallophosphoesterase family protein [Halochromatium glycolicum]MBK1703955.1 hypothetical protein [Halochromatium glycolicum]